MPDSPSSIEEMARTVLGIDGPARLDELAEVADLVAWATASMRRMQDVGPEEPPPAITFRAEGPVADFWRGEVRDG